MSDYSAWDDFYISEAVARHCGIDIEETVVFINTGTDSSKHYYQSEWLRKVTDNKRFWKPWNPCNNPADAWPIIIENKISLNWSETEKSWCAHVGGVMTEGCWCWDNDPSHHHGGSNPLRAAMIVFLMMKESSHA